MEVAEAYLAVPRAGGIAVCVNPGSSRAELAHVLADSGARIVVTDAAHLEVVRDVEATLAGAALVVERELITNRHGGNPMECRAGVALWEPADRNLTFWNGTQVPHIVRNMLAELLDLPEGNFRVIAPDVGGGFGVKAVLYPEDVALCMIAQAMPGVPVKWVEDRAEHLLAATHARDHRYLVRAGFADDGTLLALDADVTCNVGAYSVYPWTAGIEPLMAGGQVAGPEGLRTVPVEGAAHRRLTTVLADDEMITRIWFPVPQRWGFAEFARRHGDFALVVAVIAEIEGVTRITLGRVGGAPVRSTAGERVLAGGGSAREAVAEELEPTADLHGSVPFRRAIAAEMVRRALAQAGIG